MSLKGLRDVTVDWAIEEINSKFDIINLVRDKYSALKLALALGLCKWRDVCGYNGCMGRVVLEERVNRRGELNENLWWRCCVTGCRHYSDTFTGSLFPGFRTSWQNLIIVIWETCYDNRITSEHVARVCCVVLVIKCRFVLGTVDV